MGNSIGNIEKKSYDNKQKCLDEVKRQKYVRTKKKSNTIKANNTRGDKLEDTDERRKTKK